MMLKPKMFITLLSRGREVPLTNTMAIRVIGGIWLIVGLLVTAMAIAVSVANEEAPRPVL